jgi:predicted transcriptional regulator
MEVHFTPEQEAQLTQIASHAGSNPEVLVKNAALRLLEEERRFVDAVYEGEAALDRGDPLTHDQVGNRLERFLKR